MLPLIGACLQPDWGEPNVRLIGGREETGASRLCRAARGASRLPDATRAGRPAGQEATWLTHLEFDWESPLWRHWLEGLADGRMVLRYDERGCGLSDRDAEDVSLDARVADLKAVIDAAEFERVALLGISQGGPVAVAFAARHPERVSRLALFATFARGRAPAIPRRRTASRHS